MANAPDLIDWPLALRVGRSVAGIGPSTTPEYRADVRRDFAEFTRLSDELVRDFTGLMPSEPAPEPTVLDRAGWIRANTDSFRAIIKPLSEKLAGSVGRGGLTRRATSAALGVQIGVLLGYLSQKVLGQYDLVLATESAGRVYFVGPNVVEAERRWHLDPRDFRLWITLHEITHRTQFTGVPWLRDRVRALISRAIGGMDMDAARVRRIVERGKELLLQGPKAWRSVNIMTLLMSDEQLTLLEEMQALMCVVEGHGTFVMNRIGSERIPTYTAMKEAVESRRGKVSGAERTFQKVIGMDMKYEQYALGEQFMNEVAERAGIGVVNRIWESEQSMPTLEEMRDPDSWLARVGV